MFVSDPVRQVTAGELPGPPPTDLTQTAVGLAGDGPAPAGGPTTSLGFEHRSIVD